MFVYRIPPYTAVTHADINCELPAQVPLHMFAFRSLFFTLFTILRFTSKAISVPYPDPNPNPSNPYVFGLLDPDPDPS
jgi:hypothetical protein